MIDDRTFTEPTSVLNPIIETPKAHWSCSSEGVRRKSAVIFCSGVRANEAKWSILLNSVTLRYYKYLNLTRVLSVLMCVCVCVCVCVCACACVCERETERECASRLLNPEKRRPLIFTKYMPAQVTYRKY